MNKPNEPKLNSRRN